MRSLFRTAAAAAAALLVSGAASAAPVTYSSQSLFLAAVGSSITDDYSNPGYLRSNGPQPSFMTDAYMSSVLGQTRYVDTMFPNHNEVVGPASGGNPYFCTGCNGTFDLVFKNTSLTANGGVFGVSFNFRNGGVPSGGASTGYDFLVTFADGTTWDYVPDLSGPPGPAGFTGDFFGVTSLVPIADIYFGDHGAASMSTILALDNLTIAGAKTPVPEPLTLGMFGVGLAGMAALRRRRANRA